MQTHMLLKTNIGRVVSNIGRLGVFSGLEKGIPNARSPKENVASQA
jgi:hypothetical protein